MYTSVQKIRSSNSVFRITRIQARNYIGAEVQMFLLFGQRLILISSLKQRISLGSSLCIRYF